MHLHPGLLAMLALAGSCNRAAEDSTSPEGVYRAFMIANLAGRREQIGPLIIDHPDAALLWTGAPYPPAVADALSRQYRAMKIRRTADAHDHKVLESAASPIPLEVRRVNGSWRLDASPIIDFRRPKLGPAALIGEWALKQVAMDSPAVIGIGEHRAAFDADGGWTYQTTMMGKWAGMELRGSGSWFIGDGGLVYTAGANGGTSAIHLEGTELWLNPDPVIAPDGNSHVESRYVRRAPPSPK